MVRKITIKNTSGIQWALYGVVVVAFLLTFQVTIIQPASTAQELIVAIHSVSAEKNIEKSLKSFNAIFEKDTFGTGEAREQFLRMSSLVSFSKEADTELVDRYLDRATQEAHTQTVKHPYDTRARLFLGAFYNQFGRYDSALRYLNEAKESSPQKQDIYLEMARSYEGKRDVAKAEELLREGYLLEKNNPDMVIAYAQFLLAKGDAHSAKNILLEHFGEEETKRLLSPKR